MKTIIYVMKAATVIFATCCLSTCSTDEYGKDDEGIDEEQVNNIAPFSQLYDKEGKPILIQQVGQMKFTFDDSGKLTAYTKEGINHILQASTLQYIAEDEDSDTIITSMETNSMGLISKVRQHYRYEYGSYYLTGSVTGDKLIEFKYNNDSQMTDVSYTNTYYYLTDENENDSNKTFYKSTGSIRLTWEDGNLTRCNQQLSVPTSDGYNAQRTLTFEYGEDDNVLRQFPYTVGIVAFNYIGEEHFCLPGMLGYGPRTLPTKCIERYTEEYKDETNTGADIYDYVFGMNDNGTLKWESVNKHKYTYKYIQK